MSHTPHHTNDCHDHLADRELHIAQQLTEANHPVMDEDRVSQLETQILAQVTMQHHLKRHRIIRGMRWAVAACVLLVMAVSLAIGFALLDEDGPHLVTPAYDSSGDTVQPVSQPVIIRESGESSVFMMPLTP